MGHQGQKSVGTLGVLRGVGEPSAGPVPRERRQVCTGPGKRGSGSVAQYFSGLGTLSKAWTARWPSERRPPGVTLRCVAWSRAWWGLPTRS